MGRPRTHPRLLAGNKFKRLTLLSVITEDRGNEKWLCDCDCGAIVAVWSNNLRSGRSGSCGCLRKDVSRGNQRGKRHGESGVNMTPEYMSWSGMMRRCYSPNAGNKQYYSELGVTVYEPWHTYENFLADMGRKPTPQHSIDRFPNPAGNYEPSNCRWATASEQNLNKRPKVKAATN